MQGNNGGHQNNNQNNRDQNSRDQNRHREYNKPIMVTAPITPDDSKKVLFYIIVGVVVFIVAIWSLVAMHGGGGNSPASVASEVVATTTPDVSVTTPTPKKETTSPSVSPVVENTASDNGPLVIPTPQSAGLEVTVSHMVVSVPTWVVIYEDHNGQPGNVLGAGLFVAGRESGVVELLRGTLPGQTYLVGESRDDGDHMYSAQNDPAIRDANGDPMLTQFQTK